MEAVHHLTGRLRRLPLSIKMLTVSIILVLTITPLLVAGFLSQQNTRQNLLEDKREELRLDAEAIASAIDKQIATRKVEAQAVGQNTSVREFVAEGPYSTSSAEKALVDLQALMSVRADIASIFLVDTTTGQVLLTTGSNDGIPFDRRAFLTHAASGEISVSPPSRDQGRDLIYYAAPIPVDGTQSAVVAVTAVSAEDIWQHLEREHGQLARGWSSVITDENGIRIGHSSTRGLLYSSWGPMDAPAVQMLVSQQLYGSDITGISSTGVRDIAAAVAIEQPPGNVEEFEQAEDGELYEAGLAQMSEADWVIVESIPQSSFLSGADTMRFWMVLIIGFTILSITLLTFMIGRMALKPLRQLLSSVESMSNGDLDTPVPLIQDREMSSLARQFENMRIKVMESFRDLQQGYIDLAKALVASLEARDPYTAGHTERVKYYCTALSKRLCFSNEEVEDIKRAAELHDIGKVGVPDAILLKPSRLSPGEAAEIKRHPAKSGEIVSYLGFLKGIIPIIEGHHEHYDGSGYPDGLEGEEIPLGARILAVVDAYDAMTSNRAYRSAMEHENAVEVLRRGAGSQWDPEIVISFIEYLEDERSTLRTDFLFEEDCA